VGLGEASPLGEEARRSIVAMTSAFWDAMLPASSAVDLAAYTTHGSPD